VLPRHRLLVALTLVGLSSPMLPSTAVSSPAAPAAEPARRQSPAGAARPAPAPYTVRSVTVPVRVGPDGDQRCTVAADIYRPRGATARDRAPAILTTHGFGGSKDDANQTGIARGFAQEGYVVLTYSGLGFGGSTCRIHLDSPEYDGRAGRQLVSVLAGGKRAFDAESGEPVRIRYVARDGRGDPRVGMIGGSYGGQVQYAVAMQDPRVDALIPIITWNDLTYSLAPNNTDLRRGVSSSTPGVHKMQWTSFFFALGIADGIAGATVDPERNLGCPNFDQRACEAKAQLDLLGYPTRPTVRFARGVSVADYAAQVTAPTLVVQGQNDTLFNLQEAVATYRALRAHGTPVRMVWQSWGHSGGGSPAPGEVDLGSDSIRDTYLGRRFLAWMDHHVRGVDRAPVGPRFCWFRDWVRYDTSPERAGRAVAKAYECRDRYVGADRDTTLFLSGGDRLVTRLGAVRPGQATYANAGPVATSYSETSALEGVVVDNPPTDAPGTFVAWSSRPLDEPVAIVGSPVLRLHLDAPVAAAAQAGDPAGKLVLFAKLYDVAPDGTRHLQHRLVSPVRVGDVTEPVRVELPAVVQRLRPGHRLEVVVAASDAAYAGNTAEQPVTVTTSQRRPSLLRLPLMGALRLR
jgi:ABC-2 type transport system ATP-binding protein